jgi:hypothetical protein
MAGPVILLPRMNALDVDDFLGSLSGPGVPQFRSGVAADLPNNVTFGPVGGRQVSAAELADLEQKLFEVAGGVGFPRARSVESRAQFDAGCTPILATSALLQSGEALRDDVWAFLACSLLAPLTHWRYGRTAERWHGGVRNTFQRLWIRSRALDRGQGHQDRWGLAIRLSEDALVAITERPAISQRKPLAVAIAEGWVRASEAYGRARMEPIMRQAIIALRLRNEVTALAQLQPVELAAAIDRAFARAAGDPSDAGSSNS